MPVPTTSAYRSETSGSGAPLSAKRGTAAGPRAGRSLRVGILSGLGYRNQRGGLKRIRRVLAEHPDVPHLVAREPEEVRAVLGAFEDEGVDLVTVNGGDGTLSMVLTSLFRGRGGWRPLLAVLPGGRTNVSAGDVGTRGNQGRRLRGLLELARTGRWKERVLARPVLRLDAAPDAEPVYGMFFGAAAVYQASLSTWKVHASKVPGMRTGIGTALNVTRMVGGHVIGRSLFRPERIGVRVDGDDLGVRPYSVLIVTTLRSMVLGLWPFWDGSPAPLQMTAVAHPHRRLLRAAITGLRGRPSPVLCSENGYVSRNAHEIELRLEERGLLDGEVVGRSGRAIRLGTGGEIGFVKP